MEITPVSGELRFVNGENSGQGEMRFVDGDNSCERRNAYAWVITSPILRGFCEMFLFNIIYIMGFISQEDPPGKAFPDVT